MMEHLCHICRRNSNCLKVSRKSRIVIIPLACVCFYVLIRGNGTQCCECVVFEKRVCTNSRIAPLPSTMLHYLRCSWITYTPAAHETEIKFAMRSTLSTILGVVTRRPRCDSLIEPWSRISCCFTVPRNQSTCNGR